MNLEHHFQSQHFSNGYQLVNGVEMHGENPDNFLILHAVLKKHVSVGQFVELRIDSPRFSVHEDAVEKMAGLIGCLLRRIGMLVETGNTRIGGFDRCYLCGAPATETRCELRHEESGLPVTTAELEAHAKVSDPQAKLQVRMATYAICESCLAKQN